MDAYVLALIGGVLVGISAVLLMAVAGISGIVAGLLPPKPASDRTWRIAFILGLVLAPTVLALVTGDSGIRPPTVGPALLIAAGLLVGVGTALSNGCTSGHGICGVSRLSPRSAAAVVTFIGTGIVALFVSRHVL
jgi:uncharacterized protein